MQEWPNDLIPEIPIGKMVLDKNVDNFFNESEVYAVDPGVTVPGVQPFPLHTNDVMVAAVSHAALKLSYI